MKVISLIILLILAACGSRSDTRPPLDAKDRQYDQCYEESDSFAKRYNVKQTGKVVIEFTVLPDGKIDDEKIVESPFKDANFHACLLEITRRLEIPPASNGASKKVTKVLNFKTRTKVNE